MLPAADQAIRAIGLPLGREEEIVSSSNTIFLSFVSLVASVSLLSSISLVRFISAVLSVFFVPSVSVVTSVSAMFSISVLVVPFVLVVPSVTVVSRVSVKISFPLEEKVSSYSSKIGSNFLSVGIIGLC